MASTLSRVCLRGSNLLKNATGIAGTSRTFSASALRSKEGSTGLESTGPDPLEHATGIEKWELMAAQAGNDNPFDTYVIKPDAGTGVFRSKPILVPSINESRMVGCCCESDYDEIVWFTLDLKSGTQRCDCGYYFKLFHHDPLDPRYKPVFGKGFGSGMSPYF